MSYFISPGCCASSVIDLADYCRAVIGGLEPEIVTMLYECPDKWDKHAAALNSYLKYNKLIRLASQIRSSADKISKRAIVFSNHLAWIHAHTQSRETVRQIKYMVEAFYYAEPLFGLFGTFLQCLERGATALSPSLLHLPAATIQNLYFTGRISQNDAEGLFLPGLQGAIRRPLSAHPFNRALSVWPEYAARVKSELRNCEDLGTYSEELFCLMSLLASQTCIEPDSRIAPDCDNDIIRLRSICKRSARVSIIASALRQSYIKSEVMMRQS